MTGSVRACFVGGIESTVLVASCSGGTVVLEGSVAVGVEAECCDSVVEVGCGICCSMVDWSVGVV